MDLPYLEVIKLYKGTNWTTQRTYLVIIIHLVQRLRFGFFLDLTSDKARSINVEKWNKAIGWTARQWEIETEVPSIRVGILFGRCRGYISQQDIAGITFRLKIYGTMFRCPNLNLGPCHCIFGDDYIGKHPSEGTP